MLTHYFHLIVSYIGDHPTAAIAIIFLISAGEALFIVGLFVPSTVVLVGAGTLVGLGKLSFWPLYAAATLGAVVGDAASYWIGHVYKEHVRQVWPFSRYTMLLDRGESFFHRHGGKSVFIGRFIPGVKAVVPGIAGIVGMSPVRFTAINVISALVWSAAHLLPGMGLGRAVDVTATANPRLLELLLILLLATGLVWYATKFAFFWLLPHLDRLRLAILKRLDASRVPGAVLLRRLMSNDDGVLVPFLLGTVAAAGLVGFALVAAQMLFDPAFVRSDAAISGYLQTLRTPLFDRVMISVTMLGDASVLTPVAVAMVAAIAWKRRWRLAGAVTVAFVSALVFVPTIKTIIQRSRPIALYDGAESWRFPSGHATLSATIIGITVLILAHGFALRTRFRIYLAAALTIGLIGFSRLYLRAHWPSDVAAGLLFGGSMVFLMGLLLHGRSLAGVSRTAGLAVLAAVAIAYPLHLRKDFTAAIAAYARTETVRPVPEPAWLADPAAQAAARRILLDGDYGEALSLQTDLAPTAIAKALSASGWGAATGGPAGNLVDSVLPAKASAAAATTPLPLTHRGNPPVAVYTRAMADGMVLVLRFWHTDVAIADATADPKPLLAASLTRQSSRQLPFGLTLPDGESLDDATARTVMTDVAATLAGTAGTTVRRSGDLLLVPSVRP